jgi:hypothetical protein
MRRRTNSRVGLAAPTVDRQSAYYRDLWRRAKAFRVSFKRDGWWDLWHMHFDWDGQGNKGRWARREHLRATWRAFVRLQQQARSECRIDYQVFLNISEADSASDAVYFHTQNPNADNFPVSFDCSVALNHAPALLHGLVDLERYAVRRSQFEGSTWYVIVPRCL